MIDISSILYIYIALLVRHFKICMYRNLLYVILDINSTDINSYLRLYITQIVCILYIQYTCDISIYCILLYIYTYILYTLCYIYHINSHTNHVSHDSHLIYVSYLLIFLIGKKFVIQNIRFYLYILLFDITCISCFSCWSDISIFLNIKMYIILYLYISDVNRYLYLKLPTSY